MRGARPSSPLPRIFSAPESATVPFDRSRSSKVDDFGTNRKRVRDFLLVGLWFYLAQFLRYGDLLAKKLPIFPTPLSFGALAPHVPFGILRLS